MGTAAAAEYEPVGTAIAASAPSPKSAFGGSVQIGSKIVDDKTAGQAPEAGCLKGPPGKLQVIVQTDVAEALGYVAVAIYFALIIVDALTMRPLI
jgi:hypothetical protein